MSRVTLINITNVKDGETPLVRLDDITGELVIGKDTWRVVSAAKFEELDKKVKGNIQKVELTEEAYKKLVNVVNENKIELDKKLQEEINDVYASQKGRSQNYSYNSTIEPQGQSNAKPIDELLKLAGENPSSDYHDVYRIWKGQITKSNPWKKVIEKHQGDIFNDMKSGNYYRFVYDEEKGTAFWLKGSNTAVSDLISRLTVEGELITADKLNKMLASSVEFQQFKVDDAKKKEAMNKRLEEFAKETKNMETIISGHTSTIEKLNEFAKDPTVNGRSILNELEQVNQQAKDTGKDFNEFKERQREVNTNITREVNEAKTTSKSDLEAESKRLAEFIKEAQKAGNSALEALSNYSTVNDSKVKKVDEERAELEKKLNEFKDSSAVSLKEVSEQNKSLAFDLNSYKDANRRTIQGLEGKVENVKKETKEEITKVKKDISAITTNIIRKGTLRNGKVIGGIGGKVRLEMQVFYGTKDVTSIANDNECISWQLNDDYTRTSLGKIYDIDGATIMATNDQQVNVAGYLDKEKLLAIISPGLNMWIEKNFIYQDNRFLSLSETPMQQAWLKAHIYNDGMEVTSSCTPLRTQANGAGFSLRLSDQGDTVIYLPADKMTDGTPLVVKTHETKYNGELIDLQCVVINSGVIYEIQPNPKYGLFVKDNSIFMNKGFDATKFHIYRNGVDIEDEIQIFNLSFGYRVGVLQKLEGGRWLARQKVWPGDLIIAGDFTLKTGETVQIVKIYKMGG